MCGADYFISDLHLRAEREDLTALFETFVQRDAAGARSLTIGGDLFDVYLGPKQLRRPYERHIGALLRELGATGTEIDFAIGNRDFLLRRDASRLGMRGHRLYSSRQVGAERVIVHHGDTFCLDDRTYLAFRRFMHLMPWYGLSLVLPLRVSEGIGRFFRARSQRLYERRRRRHRPVRSEIRDEGVLPFLRRSGADTLICGHVHRPEERSYEIAGRRVRLLVLGDWRSEGAVIARAEAGGRPELALLGPRGIRTWSGSTPQAGV